MIILHYCEGPVFVIFTTYDFEMLGQKSKHLDYIYSIFTKVSQYWAIFCEIIQKPRPCMQTVQQNK